MSRLALSASRGFDIIELLATFPDRSFTMSEISRATGINIASCHAVLTTLTNRGYLTRMPNQKSYKLGLSLIAIGHGTEKSHPMAVKAMEAADKLNSELGLGVLLCSAIGNEILAVYTVDGETGLGPAMHVGERLPLVAPLGAPFYAWAPEEEVTEWIARRENVTDEGFEARVKQDLQLIRDRGYQLYFGNGDATSFAALVADMATSKTISDYKGKMSQLAQNFDYHLSQPEKIEPATRYDVVLIAAPIFDRDGRAVFNLGLGGFPMQLTGEEINRYAERLLLSCLEVMRSERTAGRVREHAG